ncbi:hypothetical protein ACJVC5_12355 [Peredibacter sp. HCB2-198]|uniref:hypothetical protein n=1 Tax=Peredibacter sp. HCB2-198 TaxID=3383025 RepID=UPI0038B627D8
MKKIISLLLLGLITTSAFPAISLHEEINGDYSEYSVEKSCAEKLLKIDRSEFRIQSIEEQAVPLSSITDSRIFYHYTNAQPMLTLLAADETDRQKAQSIIEANRGLEEILKFSFKSQGMNLAGRGFYLAKDPYSSIIYGTIQVSFLIPGDARTLILSTSLLDQEIKKFLAKRKMVTSCFYDNRNRSLVKTLILQESGIDFYFYDKNNYWFMLLNEELIQETRVITGVNSSADMLLKMTEAGRLNELNNRLGVDCSKDKPDCKTDILNTLIRQNEVSAVGKFIKGNHYPFGWKNSYQEISSAFNQSLKNKNYEMVDQFLSASCSLEVHEDQKRRKLAEYLVDKAPRDKRKLVKARKQAVCP